MWIEKCQSKSTRWGWRNISHFSARRYFFGWTFSNTSPVNFRCRYRRRCRYRERSPCSRPHFPNPGKLRTIPICCSIMALATATPFPRSSTSAWIKLSPKWPTFPPALPRKGMFLLRGFKKALILEVKRKFRMFRVKRHRPEDPRNKASQKKKVVEGGLPQFQRLPTNLVTW